MEPTSSNDSPTDPPTAGNDQDATGEVFAELETQLRQRLRDEGDAALAEAFSQNRTSFRNMLLFRMDRRLTGRVDPEDILQEAFLAAKDRLPHFLDNEKFTLFAWLRMIVVQALLDVHRRHLSAEKRSASREIKLGGGAVRYPQSTSLSIAGQIAAAQPSPSGIAVRDETLVILERTIAGLPEQDQEIIAMRHFENLSNKQVAEVLRLTPTAASNRYVRALQRLKELLRREGLELPT